MVVLRRRLALANRRESTAGGGPAQALVSERLNFAENAPGGPSRTASKALKGTYSLSLTGTSTDG